MSTGKPTNHDDTSRSASDVHKACQLTVVGPSDHFTGCSALNAEIAALEKQKPRPFPTARAMSDEAREPRAAYFPHRGNVDAKVPQLTPGVLSVAASA